MRKVHSHRSNQKHVTSVGCDVSVKRSSMPCMATTCTDASQSLPVTHRRPTARDGNRFHSAAVDETEEWAQVTIHHYLYTGNTIYHYLCTDGNAVLYIVYYRQSGTNSITQNFAET